jgi:hypothetical protein
LLALLYARVALPNLTTGLVGGLNDAYQNMWNNYWVKTAVLDLHTNPFYTTYIYYPTGTSLRFHTLNPLNGLLTMPFNLTLGYLPTTNLLFIFALWLTCFSNYLLIRHLVGNPLAAFAGAAVATYANFRVIGFLVAGQTQMISGQWLPLYILCMLLSVQHLTTPSPATTRPKPWWLFTLLAVLLLIAMALTDWQYVMYAVLLTLLYGLFYFFILPRPRDKVLLLSRLALIGILFAIPTFPLLILPMVQEALISPWLDVSYQSALHALDLGDFIGFGLFNPGYLALALAALGLWWGWRYGKQDRTLFSPAWTVLFWAIVALIFYLFALGPQLYINNTNTGIPLPYALLQNLPVLNTGRDPGRFVIVALLGVGILSAFGLKFLLTRLQAALAARNLPSPLYRVLLSAALVAILLVADLAGYFVASGDAVAVPPDWPPFYQQLTADNEHYAILELPVFSDAGKGAEHYMAYQILHGKYIFDGRTARDRKLTNPNNFVKHASLFRQLWLFNIPEHLQQEAYPGRDILTPTDYTTLGLPILNFYNVRYIVEYKDAIPPDTLSKYETIIHQVLGEQASPTYEDSTLRAYAVPPAQSQPANPLTLDVGDGWYPAEIRSDNVVFRFADRRNRDLAGQPNDFPAQLLSMNLTTAPLPATLRLTAYSYKQPRTLLPAVNGTNVATFQLTPNAADFQLDLTLQPGNNIITFASPEPPLPTDDPSTDSRLLSFAMYGVTLQPK